MPLQAWECPQRGCSHFRDSHPTFIRHLLWEKTLLEAGDGGCAQTSACIRLSTILGQTDERSALDSHSLSPLLALTF